MIKSDSVGELVEREPLGGGRIVAGGKFAFRSAKIHDRKCMETRVATRSRIHAK